MIDNDNGDSSPSQIQDPALYHVPPIVRAVLPNASYQGTLVVEDNDLLFLFFAQPCHSILENRFRKAKIAFGAIKNNLMRMFIPVSIYL